MYNLLQIVAVSLAISLLLGIVMIPMLRRLKFGQTVRDDGPETHLRKNGTPTMGGLIFIIAATVASVIVLMLDAAQPELWIGILSMLLFGLVGFVDDYIKVVKKQSLGLKAKQKIALQFVFALIIAMLHLKFSDMGTSIYVPFVKTTLDLGILYIPFVMFVIIAIVNSVNLTDGLDALATSVTIIVSLGLLFIAYHRMHTGLQYFLSAVIGGCIGFLRVNRYPAKVFMGDTGSMALGGVVAAAAMLMNIELIVPILCFVYFMESLSVIIQVAYFKRTGKRIFRMAPIHHHFEKLGWHETKVVSVFVAITIIMCIIGVTAV